MTSYSNTMGSRDWIGSLFLVPGRQLLKPLESPKWWVSFAWQWNDWWTPGKLQGGAGLQKNSSVQFTPSVVWTLCDPMNRSMPGLHVHHKLPESTQTHVHRVSDAIQPSHPLSSPSPLALNLSQHQGLFQWVNSSSQVTKVLEFQLQHQSFQWTHRTDLL